MMVKHVCKLTGALVIAGLGAGAALAHEEGHARVVYQGDQSARAVCMSIVRDDLTGLKSAFRRGREYLMERPYKAYECNHMRLDEFAFTQSSAEVSGYLAGKFGNRGYVTIEQVTSIDD